MTLTLTSTERGLSKSLLKLDGPAWPFPTNPSLCARLTGASFG